MSTNNYTKIPISDNVNKNNKKSTNNYTKIPISDNVNENNKLTDTGETLFLICFCICFISIALSLVVTHLLLSYYMPVICRNIGKMPDTCFVHNAKNICFHNVNDKFLSPYFMTMCCLQENIQNHNIDDITFVRFMLNMCIIVPLQYLLSFVIIACVVILFPLIAIGYTVYSFLNLVNKI